LNATYTKLQSHDIDPTTADFYKFAYSLHRTHQNKTLKLKGTFQEQLYKDQSQDMVIIKSTQCGLSEYAVAKTLWQAYKGQSVIYILPTYDLKNLFVKDRVDRSLSYSKFYSTILKDQPRKAADSASMKQLGDGIIIFAGSNTPNAFISFPAPVYKIDEYDNCSQENIIMLPERQSATAPEKRSSEKFGNPTIQNFGIDAEYKKTDKKEWHIKCPHCNKWVHPDFFKHVVMEVEKGIWIVRDPLYTGQEIINPICECGKPYNRFQFGEWVAEYPERKVSGYHVSKMFSTLNTLNELVARFNDGLTNESTMQRVYNGDLGLAYTAKGSKIDADILDSCIDRNYYMPDSTQVACIAGVDVGRLNNICIGEPLQDGKIKMVYIGAVRADEPAELLAIFKKYNVRFFIIDAMPETRYSKKIISYMNGRGFMNFYSSDKRDLGTPNNENAVANSRTQALDAVKEFLLLNQIILPANARDISGFYEQIGELTRVYDEKKDCYNWQGEGADHYFHAMAYMVLAKRYLNII